MDKIIYIIKTTGSLFLVVESDAAEALDRTFGKGSRSRYNPKHEERNDAIVIKMGIVTADVDCDIEHGTYISQHNIF